MNFFIGWGVFWLLVWASVVLAGVLPPRMENDEALRIVGSLGVAISLAWIFAFSVARALS